MKLKLAENLALPLDWMTMATVVYGARGSGKTTLGSVVAEEVTKAKQRFCAVDLKGDWYGLKSTADGKGEGLPVVVFGGDHADLPLEDGAGAFIGETIATLEQSAIVDLEYFSKGKQVRFLAAFFERLYDRNREPLLLLLDEAQRYAPQRPIDPDAAKCLGAVEDLVKLGRKHGIGPMLLTQRGSGLNKEVSELCDMLVAFRTPGPLDQDRIKDWLDANATREQRDKVLGSLAGLPTGTAVVASGHPDIKVFGTFQIRRRETFDSSATPKVGQRRAEPKRLAKPDLEKLKVLMAATIEKAKADDPRELRQQIAELKKQTFASDFMACPACGKPPSRESLYKGFLLPHTCPHCKAGVLRWERLGEKEKREALKPVLTDADRALLDGIGKRLDQMAAFISRMKQGAVDEITEALKNIRGDLLEDEADVREAFLKQLDAKGFQKILEKLGAVHPLAGRREEVTSRASLAPAPAPRADLGSRVRQNPPSRPVAGHQNGTGSVKGGKFRAMLVALAQAEKPLQDGQLSARAGMALSGTFDTYIGQMRQAGWVVGTRQDLQITEDGLRALGDYEPLPTGEALRRYWLGKMGTGKKAAMLRVLLEAYPAAITDRDVAERAEMSLSGTFDTYIGQLRALMLVEGPRSALRASEELFA